MNSFLEFVAFSCLMLIGTAVLLAVLFIPAAWLDKLSCESKARAMHVTQTWGPLQGCVIQVGESRVPIETYRGIESVHK
jgi:hypothetical protein